MLAAAVRRKATCFLQQFRYETNVSPWSGGSNSLRKNTRRKYVIQSLAE